MARFIRGSSPRAVDAGLSLLSVQLSDAVVHAFAACTFVTVQLVCDLLQDVNVFCLQHQQNSIERQK